jgi:hypothetical protein
MKRELFYVAASRGRESLTILTSDRDELRESIARTGARQSASELARKAELEPEHRREGLQPGLARGLDAARHLAQHHAQHAPYREAAETIKMPALEKVLEPKVQQHEITRGFGYGLGR